MHPAWWLGGRGGLARGAGVVALVATLVVGTSTARAHPLLDQAESAFEQADFEGALQAFSRAESALDLTRDDLVQLYLRRALVHHAMGQLDQIDLDLFRLATLEPRLHLGREIPPQVRDRFAEQARRVENPLRVKLEASEVRGGIRVRMTVSDDLAGLVSSVRFGLRTAGGTWQRSEGGAIELMGDPDAEVEYYAEAVGPGGAVVASDGGVHAPSRTTIGALLRPGSAIGGGGGHGGGEGGGLPVWPFLIGGAVAVAVAVVLVVVLVNTNDNSQLIGPTFRVQM